jgi:hypothetical protein
VGTVAVPTNARLKALGSGLLALTPQGLDGIRHLVAGE